MSKDRLHKSSPMPQDSRVYKERELPRISKYKLKKRNKVLHRENELLKKKNESLEYKLSQRLDNLKCVLDICEGLLKEKDDLLKENEELKIQELSMRNILCKIYEKNDQMIENALNISSEIESAVKDLSQENTELRLKNEELQRGSNRLKLLLRFKEMQLKSMITSQLKKDEKISSFNPSSKNHEKEVAKSSMLKTLSISLGYEAVAAQKITQPTQSICEASATQASNILKEQIY